jgi:hypothetical protein
VLYLNEITFNGRLSGLISLCFKMRTDFIPPTVAGHCKKMKKTIIILVILGLSVSIYSQNMNTESVLEIYNQTFLDFFSNKAKHTESKEFFILSDSSHQNIKTDFEDFKIHFITEEESKKLIKKNKISELYWTRIEKISKDTMDCFIGGWTVDYKRKLFKGNFTYAAWCGGTSGFLPKGRLVYNSKSKDIFQKRKFWIK